MNAVEFVKKHGWEEAKKASESIFNGDVTYKREEINIDDLKRLVESWELIQSLGGVEKCKGYVQVCFYKGRETYGNRLKQAIADVESVGGGV